MRQNPVLAALAAGVLLAGACTTAGPRGVPPGEVPGIAGRDCGFLTAPDSTTVLSGLESAGVDAPLTISVRYGPDGSLEWAREIGPVMTPSGTTLAAAVERAAPSEADPEWGYRVRFAQGRPPRALRSVHCEAALPPGTPFLLPGGARMTMADLPRDGGPFRMSAEVRVDPTGRPSDPLVRVHSEIRHFYQHLHDSSLSHRYLPALHDGFAVGGTFEFETEIGFRVTRR